MSTDAPLSSTTTIPSSPTINTNASSSQPPPNPPPNTTPLQRLHFLVRTRIVHLARRTDTNLLRLSNLLSTPSGTDALLCTIGYLLELHSTLLSKYLSLALTSTATSKPGEVVLAPPSLRLEQLLVGAKALAGIISDFRIFVRLWGLVGIYVWARTTYNSPRLTAASTRVERLLRGITYAQVGAGVAFQVLENGAYLASKGVLWNHERGRRREVTWWVWSSRFWAAHVGLELLRLGVEARSRSKAGGGGAGEKDVLADGEKEGKMLREEARKMGWAWWRDALSNAAYAPMTLHWSVEEGLLSELAVGVCGTIAGGTLLVDKWKSTK
jgi:hypothetical protein